MAPATIIQGLNSSHYARKVNLICFFSKRLIRVVVAFNTWDLSVERYYRPNVNFHLLLNNNFFDRFELLTLTSWFTKSAKKQLAS